MRDELLPYYESELTFLRHMGAEFADKYPKIAGRLRLDSEKFGDPHVERLVESFALLAARIHHKLDDEFPEITEALLEALYPHYLRPIPSMAIAQFEADPSQSKVASGIEIPSGAVVESQPQEGAASSFRTCYPVKLWPIQVTAAGFSTASSFGALAPSGAAYAVRVSLACRGGLRLAQLPLDTVRFYLHGEDAARHTLYELLFSRAAGAIIRDSRPAPNPAHATLLPGCLRPVGFSGSEGLLPYSERSFMGYRLLQEYFHFPEKFLFVDIDLSGIDERQRARFSDCFELVMFLGESGPKSRIAHLEQAVGPEMFELGCAPIVNLFERPAEPIRLTHTKTEYRVIADQYRQMATEVYAVNTVEATAAHLQESQSYAPFYAHRHAYDGETNGRYWIARRRASIRKGDNGTEVYLSLVDANFNPDLPPVERLSVMVTCTNRDFAAGLKWRGVYGELDAAGRPLVRTRCLRRPTAPARPPLSGGLQWRLISHLSLNHLSLVERGREALQEILRLYDFTDHPSIRKQIAGIAGLSSEPCVSRVVSRTGVAFCRGIDVALELDEDQFVGSGVFLMAAVLERFFGLYSAINSFSRLTVTSTQRGVLKQWAPRAGEQVLL